jgi:methyltransferase (TIGR00027 family)
MAERSASRTALGVAAVRVIHQLMDGEPKILVDPIAARLLSGDAVTMLEEHIGRARDPAAMDLRARVVLRSRYAEDRLEEAFRRGVRQCVMLGAGFDTFAYRQPHWAQDLRIYEVDHAGTQAEKRHRLSSAGVPLPANLEYVAIDFERVSLADGLRASTLDISRPAFFSCLGVFVYLTRPAVDAVFKFVATFPAGSEIAFTFASAQAQQSALARTVQRAGEPWQTFHEPASLTDELHALGFSQVSILGVAQAERTYFSLDRSDGLHAPARASIAAAVVG